MDRVTLLLANSAAAPDGDTQDRLELLLRLTPMGLLDASAYQEDPNPWEARRWLADRAAEVSELIAVEGGWALRAVGDEDGPLSIFQVRTFRPGDYAMLQPPDMAALLYRVIAVEPA